MVCNSIKDLMLNYKERAHWEILYDENFRAEIKSNGNMCFKMHAYV